jgi:hypothetical protein
LDIEVTNVEPVVDIKYLDDNGNPQIVTVLALALSPINLGIVVAGTADDPDLPIDTLIPWSRITSIVAPTGSVYWTGLLQ